MNHVRIAGRNLEGFLLDFVIGGAMPGPPVASFLRASVPPARRSPWAAPTAFPHYPCPEPG
jgi:hypothetical protein